MYFFIGKYTILAIFQIFLIGLFSFRICNNKECKNPYNNKPYFYNVGNDGEPIIGYCPVCKNVMDRAKGPYGFFWKCPHCNKNYRDKNGMPDFSPKPNNIFVKKPFHKS